MKRLPPCGLRGSRRPFGCRPWLAWIASPPFIPFVFVVKVARRGIGFTARKPIQHNTHQIRLRPLELLEDSPCSGFMCLARLDHYENRFEPGGQNIGLSREKWRAVEYGHISLLAQEVQDFQEPQRPEQLSRVVNRSSARDQLEAMVPNCLSRHLRDEIVLEHVTQAKLILDTEESLHARAP